PATQLQIGEADVGEHAVCGKTRLDLTGGALQPRRGTFQVAYVQREQQIRLLQDIGVRHVERVIGGEVVAGAYVHHRNGQRLGQRDSIRAGEGRRNAFD